MKLVRIAVLVLLSATVPASARITVCGQGIVLKQEWPSQKAGWRIGGGGSWASGPDGAPGSWSSGKASGGAIISPRILVANLVTVDVGEYRYVWREAKGSTAVLMKGAPVSFCQEKDVFVVKSSSGKKIKFIPVSAEVRPLNVPYGVLEPQLSGRISAP